MIFAYLEPRLDWIVLFLLVIAIEIFIAAYNMYGIYLVLRSIYEEIKKKK